MKNHIKIFYFIKIVDDISYKNLIAKSLRIRFDKIDGFVRVYDRAYEK